MDAREHGRSLLERLLGNDVELIDECGFEALVFVHGSPYDAVISFEATLIE